MTVGDWELTDKDLRERAEYRRQVLEEAERKKQGGGFRNGAEALQAFRDLFDSDEEMDDFADYLEQQREKERARYRD